MSLIIGKGLADIFEQETPSGSVNDANTAFSTSVAPAYVKSLSLYLDGLMLEQGAGKDYTIDASGNITMAAAPVVGQSLWCTYIKKN